MKKTRDGAQRDSPLLLRALEEYDREELLDILEDPVRRQVLHDLDPDEGEIGLSELAERVANPDVRGESRVETQSTDARDDNDADSVALRLHHNHLPKLADYGLVEYDHREKTVDPETSS